MKKKRTNKRIVGSTKVFVTLTNIVAQGVYTCDGVARFRERVKDSVAKRMEVEGKFQIHLNRQLIAESFVGRDYFIHCVDCIAQYNEGERERRAKLKLKCNFKDVHKALQLARQDCLKCTELIKKVLDNCYLRDLQYSNVEKLVDLSEAVVFYANLVYKLLDKRKLPIKLTAIQYNLIYDFDSTIEKLYCLNGDKYFLMDKKSKCSDDLFTKIYCVTYFNK